MNYKKEIQKDISDELETLDELNISNMQKQVILDMLRNKKCRITQQRMLLLDIILEGKCDCSKEIYYKAVRIDSKMGMATVYRMINTLEEIGAINRTNMYHIVCDESCNKSEMCKIRLDNQSEIKLSEQKWKQVVTQGLKSCGYIEDQKLESVEFFEANN